MMALLQRVSEARVLIDGAVAGEIGPGLLVLVCAERGDTEAVADKLLAKLLKLRIFNDAQGKMNHSVQNMDGQGRVGGLLVVSQFTLAADVSSGTRPGFSSRCVVPSGMYVDSFSDTRKVSPPLVTLAVPLTTIQCSARWWCICSDSVPPGLTTMRLT